MNTTLTLENFTQVTGHRFRASNKQKARMVLTPLSDNERAGIAASSLEEAADTLNAFNKAGKPLAWVEDAIVVAQNWSADLALTREQAFEEFLDQNKLDQIKTRQRPDVPVSVYLDPDLTVDNFTEKVKAAIGVARRFRVSNPQKARMVLTEVDEATRTAVANSSIETAASLLNAFNKNGKPLAWVEHAISFAAVWSDKLSLTRDEALAEMVESKLQEENSNES